MLDLERIGTRVHLQGTIWADQQTGELYLLPLTSDTKINVSASEVVSLDSLTMLKLTNRAWTVEAARYYGDHKKVVKTIVSAMKTAIMPEIVWAVFKRDGYRCAYCEAEGVLTYDHYVPVAHGGCTNIENGRACCRVCNRLKADQTPEQWLNSLELSERKKKTRSINLYRRLR